MIESHGEQDGGRNMPAASKRPLHLLRENERPISIQPMTPSYLRLLILHALENGHMSWQDSRQTRLTGGGAAAAQLEKTSRCWIRD